MNEFAILKDNLLQDQDVVEEVVVVNDYVSREANHKLIEEVRNALNEVRILEIFDWCLVY